MTHQDKTPAPVLQQPYNRPEKLRIHRIIYEIIKIYHRYEVLIAAYFYIYPWEFLLRRSPFSFKNITQYKIIIVVKVMDNII